MLLDWNEDDLHEALQDATQKMPSGESAFTRPIVIGSPGKTLCYCLSVQAGDGFHSAPGNAKTYKEVTHWEVALFVQEGDVTTDFLPLSMYVPILAEWDSNFYDNKSHYSYLPTSYVLKFINGMFERGYIWIQYN